MHTKLYNTNDVERYWNLSLPGVLPQEETVRVVKQIKEKDGTYGKFGILTEKRAFRKPSDLTTFLDELQQQNPDKEVGISVSTAVFNYTGETPKIDAFKYSRTIAIDIDTHIGNTKERYRLGGIEEDHIRFAAIHAWVERVGGDMLLV